MKAFGAIVVFGIIAAALIVVSALVYNWVWDVCDLDTLTGVKTTFSNWIGILVVTGGIATLAKNAGSSQ